MSDADALRRMALASKAVRAERKSKLGDGESLEAYVEDGEIPLMPLKPVPKSLLTPAGEDKGTAGERPEARKGGVGDGGGSRGNGGGKPTPSGRRTTKRGTKKRGKAASASHPLEDGVGVGVGVGVGGRKSPRKKTKTMGATVDGTDAEAVSPATVHHREATGAEGLAPSKARGGETVDSDALKTGGAHGDEPLGLDPEPEVGEDDDAGTHPVSLQSRVAQPPAWIFGGDSADDAGDGGGVLERLGNAVESEAFLVRFDDADAALDGGDDAGVDRCDAGTQSTSTAATAAARSRNPNVTRGHGTGTSTSTTKQLSDQALQSEMALVRAKLELMQKRVALEKMKAEKSAAAATTPKSAAMAQRLATQAPAASKSLHPPGRKDHALATASTPVVKEPARLAPAAPPATVATKAQPADGDKNEVDVPKRKKPLSKKEKRASRKWREQGQGSQPLHETGVGAVDAKTRQEEARNSGANARDPAQLADEYLARLFPEVQPAQKIAAQDHDTRRELEALELAALRIEVRRDILKRQLEETVLAEEDIRRRKLAIEARLAAHLVPLPPPPPKPSFLPPPPPPPRLIPSAAAAERESWNAAVKAAGEIAARGPAGPVAPRTAPPPLPPLHLTADAGAASSTRSGAPLPPLPPPPPPPPGANDPTQSADIPPPPSLDDVRAKRVASEAEEATTRLEKVRAMVIAKRKALETEQQAETAATEMDRIEAGGEVDAEASGLVGAAVVTPAEPAKPSATKSVPPPSKKPKKNQWVRNLSSAEADGKVDAKAAEPPKPIDSAPIDRVAAIARSADHGASTSEGIALLMGAYESPMLAFRGYRAAGAAVVQSDVFTPAVCTRQKKRGQVKITGPFGSGIFKYRVDPNRALCPFDLRGLCHDPQCPWQSRADYTLNGDEMQRMFDACGEDKVRIASSGGAGKDEDQMDNATGRQYPECSSLQDVRAVSGVGLTRRHL